MLTRGFYRIHHRAGISTYNNRIKAIDERIQEASFKEEHGGSARLALVNLQAQRQMLQRERDNLENTLRTLEEWDDLNSNDVEKPLNTKGIIAAVYQRYVLFEWYIPPFEKVCDSEDVICLVGP
jgi:hypothetical protein